MNDRYKMGRNKIIVIVGPTASGKSDLAVKFAQKIGGEIISADSRQVYIGMNIGTGKITNRDMKKIPHHLLDVSSPKKDFNVSHFKKKAEEKIKDIIGRGKTPIIAGGTGFWIDTLIYDLELPEVKPDKKLRQKLEKLSAEKLFSRLQKIDPSRAKTIDSKNKRRMIRAIEIINATGKTVPDINILSKKSKYKVLLIGINPPKEVLNQRIYGRLIKRLRSGMIGEVKKLHNSGVSWKRLDDFGLEYRYVSRYLRGQLAYDKMVKKLYFEIKHYAKRQLTWFKRNKNINWVESSDLLSIPPVWNKV